MGLFSRRQQPTDQPPPPSTPAPPAPVDLTSALQIFAVESVKAQSQFAQMQHQQTIALVELNAEIARNMVRTGGKRLGGKVRARTAKRDERGRMRAECRLCENPSIADPTADEIRKHATHAPRPAPRSPARAPALDDRDDRSGDADIQIDPRTGDEVIECASCGTPHADGAHIN